MRVCFVMNVAKNKSKPTFYYFLLQSAKNMAIKKDYNKFAGNHCPAVSLASTPH